MLSCYTEVAWLFRDKKIDDNNYSYLIWTYNEYKSLVESKQIVSDEDLIKYLSLRIKHWYKVLFEVK